MTKEDRIFGDMTYLDLRIDRFRVDTSGVRHNMRTSPSRIVPNKEFEVFATTSKQGPFERLTCWYTTNGQEPDLKHASAIRMEPTEVEWDAIEWDYVQHWKATVPSQKMGTVVRYKIGAKVVGQDRWVFADNQAETPTEATPFAVAVCDEMVPNWAQEALIYHVFIDRFYPGDGKQWNKPKTLSGFFGGTLNGVIQKLDYIQSLGFNAIWLSPFLSSPSHHGYNATDYHTVEPRLGNNEQLERLFDEVHRRGMRIIMDFVANHWSHLHPTFQAAKTDPDSPYHDWYIWEKWPKEYRTYFGVKELPTLNLDNQSAREYLIECAQYWLKKGIDGLRLDYALGPSYDFWALFYKACKEIQPECWLLGEVVDSALVQLSYFSSMDGTLDFLLNKALRETFAFGNWSLIDFEAFLAAHERYFPKSFSRPSFLDNHDMNRFKFISGGNIGRLKIAALVLYTLAGPPIVYYGTEVGVSQERPIHQNHFGVFEEARLPMKWNGEQDLALLDYFRRLGELRQEYPVLNRGSRTLLHLDVKKGTYAYLRSSGEKQILVAINLNKKPNKISFPDLNHAFDLKDRLNESPVHESDGVVTVELAGYSGAFVV